MLLAPLCMLHSTSLMRFFRLRVDTFGGIFCCVPVWPACGRPSGGDGVRDEVCFSHYLAFFTYALSLRYVLCQWWDSPGACPAWHRVVSLLCVNVWRVLPIADPCRQQRNIGFVRGSLR